MANISPDDWTYDTAAHLLLRAGFGHNGNYRKSTAESRQVRFLANKTPDKAVEGLLKMKVSKFRGPATLTTDTEKWKKLQAWWLERMMRTTTPVREKTVLFLHTHFATAKSKVDNILYMAVQNALFREFSMGDFRELCKRINIDPAMLWWLDGKVNKKSALNENYGRELQELFTLGVYDFAKQRNYSQHDVHEAARMLTGWRTYESHGKIALDIEAFFGRHDKGSKTMFAPDPTETPNQNPANQYTEAANSLDETLAADEHRRLVDAIFNHVDTEGRPTVARHIARQAWKFFAYDPVVDVGTSRADLTLIDDLATVFKGIPPTLTDKSGEYNMKNLLRAMFLREEFYADATRTVKGPVEYVVGTMRMLRGKLTGDTRLELPEDGTSSVSGVGDMGQTLFDPPNVFSWRGNQSWITTQTLLSRYNFARYLSQHEKPGNELGFNINYFLDPTETSRSAVVDRLLKLLCVDPLSLDAQPPIPPQTDTRSELIAWLGNSDPIDLTDAEYVDVYVRGLVNLILTLPQYHVH